jgi:MFS family permease
MIAAGMATVPVDLYTVPFAQSLGITMERLGKYFALTYVISLCLAYFLGMLADRFHPLRLSILSIALYGAAMLWGALYATTASRFLIALLVHGVLSGTYGTASASLSLRLFPRSTFAQFSAAAGVLGSLVGMAIVPLFGVALDLSGHVYRLTFVMSCGFGVLGTVLLLIVYAKFMRLGGPESYVAPE